MKSREQKRTEALKRNAAWTRLSLSQQIASLDARGLVAKKQRAKIAAKQQGGFKNE